MGACNVTIMQLLRKKNLIFSKFQNNRKGVLMGMQSKPVVCTGGPGQVNNALLLTYHRAECDSVLLRNDARRST